MKSWSRTGILSALILLVSVVEAAAYEVTIRRNIEYVDHDGVKLHGDLYHPGLSRTTEVADRAGSHRRARRRLAKRFARLL